MTATTQTTGQQASLTQEVVPQWAESSSQPPTPPPGFAEMVQSLHWDRPSRVVAGIPLGLTKDQSLIQMIGSSIMSACLARDSTSGVMCIDMVMCAMSLLGMGLDLTVDGHHIPALQEASDLD